MAMIFLEFGTDNVGIAILFAVIVYIIWGLIDPDSMVKSLTAGSLKQGERGARWARNRRRRESTDEISLASQWRRYVHMSRRISNWSPGESWR